MPNRHDQRKVLSTCGKTKLKSSTLDQHFEETLCRVRTEFERSGEVQPVFHCVTDAESFDVPAMTYYAEQPTDHTAYITLFPIGALPGAGTGAAAGGGRVLGHRGEWPVGDLPQLQEGAAGGALWYYGNHLTAEARAAGTISFAPVVGPGHGGALMRVTF